MGLELNQIKQLLKAPKSAKALKQARDHESRLGLHADTTLDVADLNKQFGYTRLLSLVKGLISADKFERFKQLFKSPFDSQELVDDIYTELSKIWDAQNPSIDINFDKEETKESFKEFLNTKGDPLELFKREGTEIARSSINTFIAVDLAIEQTTETPEPFVVFITVDRILDVKINPRTDICEYIIFKSSEITLAGGDTKEFFAVYDDEAYKIYSKTSQQTFDQLIEEVNNPHDLGYCPVRPFWSEKLNQKIDLIQRKAPITNNLTEMDRYAMFETFITYADSYGAFPIIQTLEPNCSYDPCEGGFINKIRTSYDNGVPVEESYQDKCPHCSDKITPGPGSILEVPDGSVDDQSGLAGDIIRFVNQDVSQLTYITGKNRERRADIANSVLGNGSSVLNREAINEQQTAAIRQSEQSALMDYKRNFEIAIEFTIETMAKLMFADRFISVDVFLGSQFLNKSIELLDDEFKASKEDGQPDSETDSIYLQKVSTKYMGNPDKIRRERILLNLNPMPYKNLEEAGILLDKKATTIEDYTIKVNFNNFIKRFERENGSILNFGIALDFNRKIETIETTLISYANEIITKNTSQQPEVIPTAD